ncbi:hypothetical protein [Pseudonocardia asaccharolytica]|uniref:hypothetical protein n=1 Tax=Pseudonocardia asaccharolytica TaxID=54010 RepID=UPI0011BEDDA2|nr:hypothetical protein [Pseudonocardia asaccharolytica]
MRAPVVAGVAGGVGTTTVAVALHGLDAGRAVDPRVDVLVCRCAGDSLHRAARLTDRFGGPGPRPVLAVTAEGSVPARSPLHAALQQVQSQFSGIVVLPRIERWRELLDPLTEASGMLAQPADALPRQLRGYATALRQLAQLVAATGRLHREPPAGHPVRRMPGPVAAAPPARPGDAGRPVGGLRIIAPDPAWAE